MKRKRAFRVSEDIEKILNRFQEQGYSVTDVIEKALRKYLLNICPVCGQRMEGNNANKMD